MGDTMGTGSPNERSWQRHIARRTPDYEIQEGLGGVAAGTGLALAIGGAAVEQDLGTVASYSISAAGLLLTIGGVVALVSGLRGSARQEAINRQNPDFASRDY